MAACLRRSFLSAKRLHAQSPHPLPQDDELRLKLKLGKELLESVKESFRDKVVAYLGQTSDGAAKGRRKATKKRRPRESADLTKKQLDAYTSVIVRGRTQKQAAIEMGCSKQNVSKLLIEAEAKVKALQSRSVNSRRRLPTDKRPDVCGFSDSVFVSLTLTLS